MSAYCPQRQHQQACCYATFDFTANQQQPPGSKQTLAAVACTYNVWGVDCNEHSNSTSEVREREYWAVVWVLIGPNELNQ